VKGVLSTKDAGKCLGAGAAGLLLSHHNNRIGYAVPPAAILPEVAALTGGQVPVFVDCGIQTGLDAFKMLALGAAGVCIGRPLMTAIRQGGAEAVRDYLLKANRELGKAMAFTGCTNLGKMDPTVIHRI
jgi:isopentenyl diphosphate isomerase/L-lactate dehydrogenase-like FMN-dependent dehydrogenase